jgi:hypothetical protein
MAIITYTKVSINPSNQLLLPSRVIRFRISAARKIVTNSNSVKPKKTADS